MKKLLLLVPLLAGCTNPAPRASAARVSTRQQLIGGPKATGMIGDYLLENDRVRVIVQAPGEGRVSTLFGGSMLDADIQRPSGEAGQGNDELGELAPSFLLEAMNPTQVSVGNDGKDGNPASLVVDGVGGDLLQMVAIMNQGLLYPPELKFRQEYKLSPGVSYVEITTSITNTGSGRHPLPFLNPQQLKNLGLDIPGIDTLQLSVPLGSLLLFGAENQLFTPGQNGFNFRFGIVDSYRVAGGFPAFPGMVVDLIASRGRGVSYGFMVPDSRDDYPFAYRNLYEPAQPVTAHSMVVPFLYASVTGAFTANPPASLAAGESFSWRSYFIIGGGDVASITDTVYELRGTPTGVFGGRILDAQTQAPVVHASVVVQDAAGGYVTQIDSNIGGLFRARLPGGDYTYRVMTDVRPTTDPVAFHVDVDGMTSRLIQLGPPGKLSIQVQDELGRAVPCKVVLVGRFPDARKGQDPKRFLYDLHLGERQRPTAFDAQSNEYIENSWFTKDGVLNADVRPGTYDLYVSRGVEYHLHKEAVVVQPGAFVTSAVQLQRALDTSGYVAADLHLHSVNSTDSDMTLPDRVTSIAAEGLEVAAATDHNFLTDYNPTIAALGLDRWLTAIVGLELTTFEMGHFNGYPLQIDPGNVRGGKFSWAGLPPDGLFDQLRNLGAHRQDVIVEVNHARDGVLGYFSQFNLDGETGTLNPRMGLRAVFAPFKPEFAPSAFSYDFDVLEVVNGKRLELAHSYRAPNPLPPPPLPNPPPNPGDIVRDADGHVAFPGQIDDWFTLLSKGQTYTGVGNSDSHGGMTQEPGYARSFIWVGEGKDTVGKFSVADVIAGLRSHRVIITNGPMIDLTVEGQPIGSLVPVGATAHVRLHVTSANFSPFGHVTLWQNGVAVQQVDVPAGQQHDFSETVDLPVTRDAWLIAEVSGTQSLFPVVPPQEWEPLNVDAVINALGAGLDLTGLDPAGNLKPSRLFRVTPLALTNPIWMDRDGNGRFDPPLPRVARQKGQPLTAKLPDVRDAFAAVKEAP